MVKENKYRYIDDAPIGQDWFSNKSQDKLAAKIEENIEYGESSVIGIEGGWGSGKSNVIKILEGKLNKDFPQKYLFFTYDVWAHQIDDYRKTLLIELSQFLNEHYKKNRNKKTKIDWESEASKLLSHTKTTKSTSMPSLGYSAILLVIIAIVGFICPPILDFLSPVGSEEPESKWYYFFTFFPLFCIMVFAISVICHNIRKNKKIVVKELLAIFNTKIESDEREEYVLERDTASHEFKQWLKKIDNELNGESKDEILIIVLDNIDRLPSNKITQLWALIQSWFLTDSHSTLGNIKLIIPFDKTQVTRSLAQSFADRNNNTDCNSCLVPDTIDIATDYIDKTFDRIYTVAPPILSDWKDFFEKLWHECFNGEYSGSVYKKVEQIVNKRYTDIRPRRLINFCNDVVTQVELHDGENIGAEYAAFYVAYKDEINAFPLEALNFNRFEPLEGLRSLFNEEIYQKAITSFVYQVAFDNAIDIIYSFKLRDALEKGDAETVKSISTLSLFDKLVMEVILNIDVEYLNSYISTLDQVNLSDKDYNNDMWLYIARQYTRLNVFDDNSWMISSILYKHINDADLKSSLLDRTFSPYSKDETLKDGRFGESKIRKFVKAVASFSCIDSEIYNHLKIKKVSAEVFVNCLKDGTIADYKNLKIQCDNAELNKYLSGISDESLSDDYKYLTEYSCENDMSELGKNVITKAGYDLVKTKRMFGILENIKQYNLLVDTKVYTQNQLLPVLNSISFDEEWTYKYYALCLLRITNKDSYYSKVEEKVFTNYAIIDSIADYMCFLVNYELPDLFATTNKTIALALAPAGKSVINSIIKKNDDRVVITENDKTELFFNYAFIEAKYTDLYEFLISKIDPKYFEDSSLSHKDFLCKIDLKLLATATEKKDQWGKHLADKVINCFKSLTKEEIAEILNNTNLIDSISEKMHFLNYKPDQEWYDCFNNILIEIIENKKDFSSSYKNFYEQLKKDKYKVAVLIDHITDSILRERKPCSKDVFLCFGDDILKKYGPDDRCNLVISYLLNDSLTSDNEVISIIEKNTDKILAVTRKAGIDYVKVFYDRIKGHISPENKLSTGLEKICISDNEQNGTLHKDDG